jgi:NitT/TauT family transport system permease protein
MNAAVKQQHSKSQPHPDRQVRGLQKFIPRPLQRKLQHSLISLLLFTLLMSMAFGVVRGGIHLAELRPEQVTLEELPAALMLSLMRVVASYAASLVFSFGLGLLAARTKWGERLILPALDILQSVPVVGFFPAAISFFIGVFQGHRFGVELAATFLIFTSQAWNMAFAVYEATKTIPQDNFDAVASFGVRGPQRFWKLYAPACVPRLVYNSILSWSNGWYFLVACEIIAIGNIRYHLPGIGSFLALAAEQDQARLVVWGLVALASLVLGVDALVWRPLSAWAERFRQDYSTTPEPESNPWNLPTNLVLQLYRKTRPTRRIAWRMVRVLFFPLTWVLREILLPLTWDLPVSILKGVVREIQTQWESPGPQKLKNVWNDSTWLSRMTFWLIGASVGLFFGWFFFRWLRSPWPAIASDIPLAILISTGRLVTALALSLIWILPLVLFTWNKPRLRRALTTVAQVGASLPAIALFPLIILILVRRFGGGMEVASILLLLTGMQWYILFNGLSGTSIIPGDLSEAARALGLSRMQTWKRLVLPAIRPALITGMITAWGGGWNALVVSEYVAYKDQVLTVNGIGALLNRAVYQLGDGRAIGLCLGAMVAWILILNTLIWRPLYQSAAERYKFEA